MAQRTIVHLIDDLDGTEGDETLRFGLDGLEYEIDLNKDHADELREFLASYMSSARKVGGSARASGGSSRGGRRKDLAEVRVWANENGFQVSDRGRIPNNVLEAYDQVH